MGYVEQSPFANIKKVRLPLKIVQPFSPDDVLRLFDCCDNRNPIGLRDRAILLVLLDTGIRVGELVRLEFSDLDLEGHHLRSVEPCEASGTRRQDTEVEGSPIRRHRQESVL